MEDPHPPDGSALHYHTQGNSFGPIPREHLARLWQTNSLAQDCLVFDPAKEDWLPASEFFSHLSITHPNPKSTAPEFPKTPPSAWAKKDAAPLPEPDGEPDPIHPKVRKWQTAFVAALLLGVLAACAAFFWSAERHAQSAPLHSKIASLEKQLAEREAELRQTALATRSKLAPDEIQGRFTIQAADGSEIPQIGAKILLFRKGEIQAFLDKMLSSGAATSVDHQQAALDIVNNLPFPTASTTTDSEGFYRFSLPEPGMFVLHTNMTDPDGHTAMWFLSFDPSTPNHGPIPINESNICTNFTPGLAITPAR
jgi:hypothetical protein